MAHGSAAELQCHLYVAIDQGYINSDEFQRFYNKIEEVSKMIQSFMNYLNKV